MPDLIADLNRLRRSEMTDPEHDLTAREVTEAFMLCLEEIILVDEDEDMLLDKWKDVVCKSRCEILGSHNWQLDHCGYWGHQFCGGCQSPKYPELSGSCSKAIEKIGNITEAEYVEQLKQTEAS